MRLTLRTIALLALTDVMATMAEMLDRPLPFEAGEDSFSFMSALIGAEPRQPTRRSRVQDSSGGMFAIREGPWTDSGAGWRRPAVD